MKKNYFGTDGIRGEVGSSIMTPELILKLGWAAGMVFKDCSSEILIGKDTRVSGYLFESALESGLCAAGMNIGLLGPMPTPAISYLTATFRCAAGIVISASHNKFTDNGIKFFSSSGEKISDEIEQQIEHYMQEPLKIVSAEQIGKARRISGAPDRYIEFCKSKLTHSISLQGMKIVIDCANGANYNIASAVFNELCATTIIINNTPNGFNINDNCGSTYPQNMIDTVLEHNADIGIAFDGDGDRVILCDAKGNILDGDDILYVLANNLLHAPAMTGAQGVVGTVMSNYALEQELARSGIDFVRAAVGDKNVMHKLKEHNWFLGGEPSGHIINLHNSYSGDGIIASILILNVMLGTELTLQELTKNFKKYPQKIINIPCSNPKQHILTPGMQTMTSNILKQIHNQGRALVRASGTEPKIRIMLESANIKLITEIEQYIKDSMQSFAAESTESH
jgi:phosphoglucosamine mutase